jgi:hypothetical protein
MKLYVADVESEIPEVKEKKVKAPKEPKEKKEKIPKEKKPRVSKKTKVDVAEQKVVMPKVVEENDRPSELEDARVPEVEKLPEQTRPSEENSKSQEEVPPEWFKKFIETTKQEEAIVSAKTKKERKPRKQIRREASDFANQQWQDPHVRDRVNAQAEQHMRKMHHLYSQMFYR